MSQPTMLRNPARTRTPALVACTSLFVICSGTIAGCQQTGLGRIDSKLDALIADRSKAINQYGAAPTIEPIDRPDRGGSLPAPDGRGTPETANPGPEDLVFTPADEARDVQEILTMYAESSLGTTGDRLPLPLDATFKLSQRSAREFLNAEETYLLSAIRLLIERRLWGPRFFADSTVAFAGSGDDGVFDHALEIIQELRVTQRLPYGGAVEARFVYNAAEQLRSVAGEDYTSASSLVLDANVPLLRGAGDIAREELLQAERNLVYSARTFERFRRELLVNIANDYFNLLRSQTTVANQQRQIERLEQLELETTEKVSAGRLRPFERNIVANRLLTARSDLASANEQFILALERFKVRLGLPVMTPVQLELLEFDIPEPDIAIDRAVDLALEYRLDLQNERDQVGDAARAVRNSENGLLPDLDVFANLVIPTDSDVRDPSLAVRGSESRYRVGATLGLPLDRDIERLNLRRSTIGLDLRRRNYEQFRDNVIIEVRQAVRNIELARFQLELAERAVQINLLRLQELELRADQTDAQTRVDAEESLLQAENNREQALTNLRNAVLNYLLSSGQMRVGRDGQFQPLPGMPDVRPSARTQQGDGAGQ